MPQGNRFKIAPLGAKNREAVTRYSDNPYLSLVYGYKGNTPSDALNPILYPGDELLLEKGGAQALNIYTRLFFDDTVQSAYARLTQEMVSRDIIIEPASDSLGDEAIAEFVLEQINNLPMDEVYIGLAQALVVGCSYGEVIWKRTSSGIVAEDIRLRDPRIFRWSENDAVKGGFDLHYLTRDQRFDGKLVPKRKFISFKYYVANTGDPYGSGLGRILYPLVKFRRRAIEAELLYADRYANPTIIITAPLSATAREIQSLYDQMSNMSQETAVILPEGYTWEIVGGQGNSGAFPNIREFIDLDIHVLMTGEAESGNPDAGSRASSEVAASVRTIRASELSQLVSTTLNETLIRWIVDYNFGVNVVAPKIKRNFILDKESSLTINDIVLMKEKLRLEVTRKWIEEKYKVNLVPKDQMVPNPEDSKIKAEDNEDIFGSIFGNQGETEGE